MKKTPYFQIDKSILDEYYDMLVESLASSWGNYIVGYSFKTNSLPWLVEYVKRRGAFAEVVSEDEYLLARYLGYEPHEVIYNGPYKGKESMHEVLTSGGIVNIDAERELRWLEEFSTRNPEQKFSIGLRVNFNLEKYIPGETTMGEESGRFGFSYENGTFAKVLSRIKLLNNVRLQGLHLHSSTKSRSVSAFTAIAEMAVRLKKEFDLNLDYIDLGGGYCGGIKNRPEYPDYFPAIAERLKEAYDPRYTKLIVEPGISLISKASWFITSVIDVREIAGCTYVITDGSRFNIDPTMIKSNYLYHVDYQEKDINRELFDKQIITGFSCMEADRLFEMNNAPKLREGDLIIYENVGGYTICLNPLFIQYFPPVLVKDKESFICARKKWTPKQYVQNCFWKNDDLTIMEEGKYE